MKSILCQMSLIIMGLTLIAPSGTHGACESYDSHINWLSTMRSDDCYWYPDFTLHDDFILAVGATGNLYVFNISDPAQPYLSTVHDLQGQGSYIVSHDQIGLLSLKNGGALILDMIDPMQLAITDTLNNLGYVSDVQFHQNLAYVSSSSSPLKVLDLSDPTNVTVSEGWRPDTETWAIEFYGEQALVLTDGLLFNLDLSDPFEPVTIDSVATNGYRMLIAGSTLVIPGRHSGFSLYDLAPGQVPTFRAEMMGPSFIRRMALVEGLVAMSFEYDMKLYEVAEGDTLIERASFGYQAYQTSGRLLAQNGVLYHTGNSGITALDIGDGTIMPTSETMPFPGGNPWKFTSQENYVFAAAGSNGMVVYDANVPMDPQIVGSAYVDGTVQDIDIVDDIAYLMGSGTFQVFDVSDPTLPLSIGGITDFNGSASDIDISGQIAWGAGGYGGVYGVDISDPTAPYLRHHIETVDQVYELETEGNLLHLLGESGNYEIYSLATDPPTLLSSISPISYGVSLTVRGDLAALGSSAEICFVNVSDPSNPYVISDYTSSGFTHKISLHGNRAVISSGAAGLITLDISNLQVPINLTTAVGMYADHVVLANGTMMTWGNHYAPFNGSPDYKTRMLPASCEFASPVLVDVPSAAVSLKAYPNPFNPRTALSFELPDTGPCRLTIYDLSGRLVSNLCWEIRSKGPQQFAWHGQDENGQGVASGVYMVQLVHVGGVETRKLALVR